MKLNLGNIPEPDLIKEEPASVPKPAWYKASDENVQSFKDSLVENLLNIQPSEDLILCRDVHCKNKHHISECDNYCLDVLNAISDSVKLNIPYTGQDKEKKVIAGWNNEVKSFQKEAQFYHALWISSGKPINTDLHWAMKNSRNQYHYAVRRAKRNHDAIVNNKFVQCCLEGKVDDLLKEVKKMRGSQSKNSTVIDDHVGDDKIANHFCDIYEELYNSVLSDDALGELLTQINNDISDDDLVDVNQITPDLIQEAIDHLKTGKSDVDYDWKSEAFIHGAEALASPLSFIFKCFLIHGHISTFLLLCSLVPLVKDPQGDKTSPSNFRAIAISSLFMKILDWIF